MVSSLLVLSSNGHPSLARREDVLAGSGEEDVVAMLCISCAGWGLEVCVYV